MPLPISRAILGFGFSFFSCWLSLAACGAKEEAKPSTPSAVFRPCMVDWQAVSSRPAFVPSPSGFSARDKDTGSTWNVLGEAISGSWGERRIRIRLLDKAYSAYWFAWSAIWPGSSVWGREVRPNATYSLPATVLDELIKPSCAEGRDCIPSLTPKWIRGLGAPEATYVSDEDTVVGVVRGERARAYPHKILWWHEAVNDRFGGAALAVTYSTLTGSAVVFDAFRSTDESPLSFGVTGSLFNSNTVFYDRETDSFWSQMRFQVIRGPLAQARPGDAATCPFIETSWGAWKLFFPETEVVSLPTGYGIDYTQYPYVTPRAGDEPDLDYRTDPDDTFRPTAPPVDHLGAPGEEGFVGNKEPVFGVIVSGEPKGYLWKDVGDRAVINDTVGGRPIVLFWDKSAGLVAAYERAVEEQILEFELNN